MGPYDSFGKLEFGDSGDIMVSIIAKNLSPFTLALDFIPGFKALWDLLSIDLGIELISYAMNALQVFFTNFIQCEIVEMKLGLQDGYPVFIGYTNGCALLKMIQLDIAVMVLFEGDLKFFVSAKVGLLECFPMCLFEDIFAALLPDFEIDPMVGKYLGLFLDVAMSPFKTIKALQLQYSSHELRLGHIDFGEHWPVDMSHVPAFISINMILNFSAVFGSIYKLWYEAMNDLFEIEEWGGGLLSFMSQQIDTLIEGFGEVPLICGFDINTFSLYLGFSLNFPKIGIMIVPTTYFKSFMVYGAFTLEEDMAVEINVQICFYFEPRAPLDLVADFVEGLFDGGDPIGDALAYADPKNVIFGILLGRIGYGQNGLYWEAAGSLRPPNPTNDRWVNPFGLFPKSAVVLPFGGALAHNTQACIGQIISIIAMITKNAGGATASGGSAAGGTAGTAGGGAGCAAYGAGAPVLAASLGPAAAGYVGVALTGASIAYDILKIIMDTLIYCIPKRFELEGGMSMCASNFVLSRGGQTNVTRFLLDPIPVSQETLDKRRAQEEGTLGNFGPAGQPHRHKLTGISAEALKEESELGFLSMLSKLPKEQRKRKAMEALFPRAETSRAFPGITSRFGGPGLGPKVVGGSGIYRDPIAHIKSLRDQEKAEGELSLSEIAAYNSDVVSSDDIRFRTKLGLDDTPAHGRACSGNEDSTALAVAGGDAAPCLGDQISDMTKGTTKIAYSCHPDDPYGGRPMYMKIGILFLMTAIPIINIPIPKFGMFAKLEYTTLGRLVTASIPFNPPFDNPFNPDTTLSGDMAKGFGINDGSLDWMSDTEQWLEDTGKMLVNSIMDLWRFVLDAIQLLKVDLSFSSWILPLRMKSTGTTIKPGLVVDVQGLKFLGLFTLRRAMVQIQIFNLPPKVACNVYIDRITLEAIGFKLFEISSMPPEMKARIKGTMAANEAAGAEARKKRSASIAASLATFKGDYDPVEQCIDDECFTCATANGGHEAIIACEKDQVIAGIEDVVWAPTNHGTLPEWDANFQPSQCSWRRVPRGDPKQLMADVEESIIAINALCKGSNRCTVPATDRELGRPCAWHQKGCDDGEPVGESAAMLRVVARCRDEAAVVQEEQTDTAEKLLPGCKKGCDTCVWNNKTDSETTVVTCAGDQLIVGVLRASYGEIPTPELEPIGLRGFDMNPGMCVESELPPGRGCRAPPNKVRRAVEKLCVGKTQCSIKRGGLKKMLGGEPCPETAHALGVIVRCMPKDRVMGLEAPGPHEVGVVHYEARAPDYKAPLHNPINAREFRASFEAATTKMRSLMLPVSRLVKGKYGAVVAGSSGRTSHSTDATTLHRLTVTMMLTNESTAPAGTRGVAVWTFRIMGGRRIFERGGRLAVLWRNPVDGTLVDECGGDEGLELCSLHRCARLEEGKPCDIAVPLEPKYYRVTIFAASSSDVAVTNDRLELLVRPPTVCVHQNDEGVEFTGRKMPFFVLTPGALPHVLCKDIARFHIEPVKAETRPFCQFPEMYKDDPGACFPESKRGTCDGTLDTVASSDVKSKNVVRVVSSRNASPEDRNDAVIAEDGGVCRQPVAGDTRDIVKTKLADGVALFDVDAKDNSDVRAFKFTSQTHRGAPRAFIVSGKSALQSVDVSSGAVKNGRSGEGFAFSGQTIVEMDISLTGGFRNKEEDSLGGVSRHLLDTYDDHGELATSAHLTSKIESADANAEVDWSSFNDNSTSGFRKLLGGCHRRDCHGHWSHWSHCDRHCGGGTMTRRWHIHQWPSCGGHGCPHHNGYEERWGCNHHPCPINCHGGWGGWSGCSKTCGGGSMSRTYTHWTYAAHGGHQCPHHNHYTETQGCNTNPCPPPPAPPPPPPSPKPPPPRPPPPPLPPPSPPPPAPPPPPPSPPSPPPSPSPPPPSPPPSPPSPPPSPPSPPPLPGLPHPPTPSSGGPSFSVSLWLSKASRVASTGEAAFSLLPRDYRDRARAGSTDDARVNPYIELRATLTAGESPLRVQIMRRVGVGSASAGVDMLCDLKAPIMPRWLSDGAWHHLALSVEGGFGTVPGFVTLWIDGERADAKCSKSLPFYADSLVMLGARVDDAGTGLSNSLDATVDGVSTYGRRLLTDEVRMLARFVPCASKFDGRGYVKYMGLGRGPAPRVEFDNVKSCTEESGLHTVTARYLLSTGANQRLALSESGFTHGFTPLLEFPEVSGLPKDDTRSWGYSPPVVLRLDPRKKGGTTTLRLSPLNPSALDKEMARDDAAALGADSGESPGQTSMVWSDVDKKPGPAVDSLIISSGASYLNGALLRSSGGWSKAFEAIAPRDQEPPQTMSRFCTSTLLTTDYRELAKAFTACHAEDRSNQVLRVSVPLSVGFTGEWSFKAANEDGALRGQLVVISTSDEDEEVKAVEFAPGVQRELTVRLNQGGRYKVEVYAVFGDAGNSVPLHQGPTLLYKQNNPCNVVEWTHLSEGPQCEIENRHSSYEPPPQPAPPSEGGMFGGGGGKKKRQTGHKGLLSADEALEDVSFASNPDFDGPFFSAAIGGDVDIMKAMGGDVNALLQGSYFAFSGSFRLFDVFVGTCFSIMPGTEADGGGIHGMFVFRLDFASVGVGLLNALGADITDELSIEAAATLDVGPIDFNKLIEDAGGAILNLSLMIGITIKPRIFETFIWAMGKMMTAPIMAILEVIFVAIEVVRAALAVAEGALHVAIGAWNLALRGLSAIGIHEAQAARRAAELRQHIHNMERDLRYWEGIVFEQCVVHLHWWEHEECRDDWVLGWTCSRWWKSRWTTRNRWGHLDCPIWRQVEAVGRVADLGIRIAAAWLEMKAFDTFLAVATELAKAKAEVRRVREDFDRELAKLNGLAEKSGINVRNKDKIDKWAIRLYIAGMHWFGIDEFTVTGRWFLTKSAYSATLKILLFGERYSLSVSFMIDIIEWIEYMCYIMGESFQKIVLMNHPSTRKGLQDFKNAVTGFLDGLQTDTSKHGKVSVVDFGYTLTKLGPSNDFLASSASTASIGSDVASVFDARLRSHAASLGLKTTENAHPHPAVSEAHYPLLLGAAATHDLHRPHSGTGDYLADDASEVSRLEAEVGGRVVAQVAVLAQAVAAAEPRLRVARRHGKNDKAPSIASMFESMASLETAARALARDGLEPSAAARALRADGGAGAALDGACAAAAVGHRGGGGGRYASLHDETCSAAAATAAGACSLLASGASDATVPCMHAVDVMHAHASCRDSAIARRCLDAVHAILPCGSSKCGAAFSARAEACHEVVPRARRAAAARGDERPKLPASDGAAVAWSAEDDASIRAHGVPAACAAATTFAQEACMRADDQHADENVCAAALSAVHPGFAARVGADRARHASLGLFSPGVHWDGGGMAGVVPLSLCGGAVNRLDLSGNRLVGTVPGCLLKNPDDDDNGAAANASYVVSGAVAAGGSVYLHDNRLAGELPRVGGHLRSLRLDNNFALQGSLERAVTKNPNLEILSTARTSIAGDATTLAVAAPAMTHLDVRYTPFSAKSPIAATEAFASMSSLRYVALAGTPLSKSFAAGALTPVAPSPVGVHVVLTLNTPHGSSSGGVCGKCALQDDGDILDCANLPCASRAHVDAVRCSVAATIRSVGVDVHSDSVSVERALVLSPADAEDGEIVSMTLTVRPDHHASTKQFGDAWSTAATALENLDELTTDVSCEHESAAATVRADMSWRGKEGEGPTFEEWSAARRGKTTGPKQQMNDDDEEEKMTNEEKEVDEYKALMFEDEVRRRSGHGVSSLPRIVRAPVARVACPAGTMGATCSLGCPATWTRLDASPPRFLKQQNDGSDSKDDARRRLFSVAADVDEDDDASASIDVDDDKSPSYEYDAYILALGREPFHPDDDEQNYTLSNHQDVVKKLVGARPRKWRWEPGVGGDESDVPHSPSGELGSCQPKCLNAVHVMRDACEKFLWHEHHAASDVEAAAKVSALSALFGEAGVDEETAEAAAISSNHSVAASRCFHLLRRRVPESCGVRATTCERKHYSSSADGSHHNGPGCQPCGYVLYYEQHVASIHAAAAEHGRFAGDHVPPALGAASAPGAGRWVRESSMYFGGREHTSDAVTVARVVTSAAKKSRAEADAHFATSPDWHAAAAAETAHRRARLQMQTAVKQSLLHGGASSSKSPNPTTASSMNDAFMTVLEDSQFPSCVAEFDGCSTECRQASTRAIAACIAWHDAGATEDGFASCADAEEDAKRMCAAVEKDADAAERCVLPATKAFHAIRSHVRRSAEK